MLVRALFDFCHAICSRAVLRRVCGPCCCGNAAAFAGPVRCGAGVHLFVYDAVRPWQRPFIAQLLAGADGKSILALLLLGIPAACAAGCLCMFGAAALQVSGRIRAYSFRKTAGQACSGARELMGQYLLVIVVFLPLCGAATGVAYLSGKIL